MTATVGIVLVIGGVLGASYLMEMFGSPLSINWRQENQLTGAQVCGVAAYAGVLVLFVGLS